MDEIEVGATYEGRSGRRLILRLYAVGNVLYQDIPSGRMGVVSLDYFASWANRRLPDAHD